MNLFTIILTAFSLSMDAFAVSVAYGISLKKLNVTEPVKVGLYFGTAQFLMPLLGWLLASGFMEYIKDYDHWIAFILLSVIGGKMIYGSVTEKESENATFNSSVLGMTVLAIATSIDALAAGISFALIDTNVLFASGVVGIVTFVVCAFGTYFGKKLGLLFRKRAEILGGGVLILLGANILIKHLFLS